MRKRARNFKPKIMNTLPSGNDKAILRVIVFTGVSSVVSQILTIREFLTLFQGNEIMISLTLCNWLLVGGVGSYVSHRLSTAFAPTAQRLAGLSLALVFCAPLQLLLIRFLRDQIFLPGSSVGFYPSLLFNLATITPYALLLGFVLPYALFLLRRFDPKFPGSRVYIWDNVGDVSGGIIFSFVLIFFATPLQAILLANLPLLYSVSFLLPAGKRRPLLLGQLMGLISLISCLALELPSLTPVDGELLSYRESRYGRLLLHKNQDQLTLIQDGMPLLSTETISQAEEAVHFAMAQRPTVQSVLLVSATGGMLQEIAKYHPTHIDYLELDPQVSRTLFAANILTTIPGLQIIHQDGRSWLQKSTQNYDVIIVSLPEPDTFQINRFYTSRFYELAQNHLTEHGVLAFSMAGFDSYLAEPQRRKLSSIYNTVRTSFNHVLVLPGSDISYICSQAPLNSDIPALLEANHIPTSYISGYFYGNVTAERMSSLRQQLDPSVPINTDLTPQLMTLMFEQWFARFNSSPHPFFITVLLLLCFYLWHLSRQEFILFSTGAMTMGSEILLIFIFQIFYGMIYFQIGVIITIFLAGLMPGAWFAQQWQRQSRAILIRTDLLLMLMLVLLFLATSWGGDRLPLGLYLAFGFCVSLLCGMQFPAALHLLQDKNQSAARLFSADLMGAAFGTILTSLILIPQGGVLWGCGGLFFLKGISLCMGVKHDI